MSEIITIIAYAFFMAVGILLFIKGISWVIDVITNEEPNILLFPAAKNCLTFTLVDNQIIVRVITPDNTVAFEYTLANEERIKLYKVLMATTMVIDSFIIEYDNFITSILRIEFARKDGCASPVFTISNSPVYGILSHNYKSWDYVLDKPNELANMIFPTTNIEE